MLLFEEMHKIPIVSENSQIKCRERYTLPALIWHIICYSNGNK